MVAGLDESARGGSEAAVLYEWGGKGKDGTDEFKARRPGWAMPIHQLLVKHKVAAVIHGHDHFFARQELDDIAYAWSLNRGTRGSIGCAMWMSMVTFAAISCRRLATFVFRCQPTGQPWRMCGLTCLRWKPLSGRMGK